MKKESFVLYDTYAEQVEFLTDEQAGTLFKSLFAYRQGKALPTMDGIVKMAFSFIKTQINTDAEKVEALGEKRRSAGKTGAVKRWQNIANDSKNNFAINDIANDSKNNFAIFEKENEEEKEKDQKEKVEDKEKENYLKEKGTSVPKKKEDGRTDEKANKQAEFFRIYPNIVIDNYSSSDYADIDFELLMQRFEESAFLRQTNSFAWICRNWRKIEAGAFRDFDKRTEERPTAQTHSHKPLGPEWDDLD